MFSQVILIDANKLLNLMIRCCKSLYGTMVDMINHVTKHDMRKRFHNTSDFGLDVT